MWTRPLHSCAFEGSRTGNHTGTGTGTGSTMRVKHMKIRISNNTDRKHTNTREKRVVTRATNKKNKTQGYLSTDIKLQAGNGGRLPPPRVLKVTFSGDDGKGGGKHGQFFPLGYASFLAAILLITKSLVCWCTNDVELAFMCIDLGFLTTLGWLCLMSHFNPALFFLHGFLIELGLASIVEELIFSGLIVNRIRPDLDYKMTKDFLVHHIASIVMGSVALMFYPFAQGTGAVAVGLIGTEVTTFLPVSFRMSVRSKRLSDSKVSAVLGALFPLAFLWRTGWSAQMFMRLIPVGRKWIATMSPTVLQKATWHFGEVGVFAVVGSNVAWTYRILRGTMKVVEKSVLGKKGKNIDAKQFQNELE